MVEKRISYLFIFCFIICTFHRGGGPGYTTVSRDQASYLPGASERNLDGKILIMDEDRRVDVGETLSISPGTVVSLGKDVRLTIFGKLLVEGERDEPVIFQRSDTFYPWEGILIEEGGFAHLRNAVISGGTRTIICNNSSPILENLSISDAQNGLIVVGDSKPLARNITLDNVVNGIGLRANELFGTDFDESATEWQVNMSSNVGYVSYPAQRISSESFTALLSDFRNSYNNDPGKVLLESSLHLSANEYLSFGDLRLVLSYDRPMEIVRGIKVSVNGIIQNTSRPPNITGLNYGFSEKNPFHALKRSGFYRRYSDMLQRGSETNMMDIPRLPNMLANEYHLVLEEGFIEGLNLVSIELDRDLYLDITPSVFIESSLPTGGVYDNITITNGGGWGIFLLDSEPFFSRMNVKNVNRHVVLKGGSSPVIIECNFFGGNASEGIISHDEAAFIRLLDSTFVDFACAPVELSQGTAAIVSCRFENISPNDAGAIQLDTNPDLLPIVSELLEIRPIVIHGIEIKNVSGWGIKVMGGRISVSDSTFVDCANGLYIGEGTMAEIYGNTLRDLSSTGILVYRAIDNRVNINSNNFIRMDNYGIVIKQTSARLYDNIIEGCFDLTGITETLTDTYLLERNWAVYIENSFCSLEGHLMSNNTYSILVGIDSTVQMADNHITGRDGIGIGVLSERAIHISNTDINVVDGFDLAYLEDSMITFEGTMYNTTAYIEGNDQDRAEGFFSVIIALIITIVLVLLLPIRGKMKK